MDKPVVRIRAFDQYLIDVDGLVPGYDEPDNYDLFRKRVESGFGSDLKAHALDRACTHYMISNLSKPTFQDGALAGA